jgi:hypothetical protein
MLVTFDAPESNVACTRRERSDTPLQALTLLNDGIAVECARGLGRRISVQTGGVPDQLRYGFQLAVGRSPQPAELARLQQFWEAQGQAFRNDPEAARQLLGGKYDGDQVGAATLVAVSRVLLNLDELITRP